MTSKRTEVPLGSQSHIRHSVRRRSEEKALP